MNIFNCRWGFLNKSKYVTMYRNWTAHRKLKKQINKIKLTVVTEKLGRDTRCGWRWLGKTGSQRSRAHAWAMRWFSSWHDRQNRGGELVSFRGSTARREKVKTPVEHELRRYKESQFWGCASKRSFDLYEIQQRK